MKQVDQDESGDIDYNEFITATMNKQILLSKDRLRVAFAAFDIDNNGSITAEELKSVLGRWGEDCRVWMQMIEEVDKNGDGVIDLKEFTEMMLNIY